MLPGQDISITSALHRITTLTDAACITMALPETEAAHGLLTPYFDDLIPNEPCANALREAAADVVNQLSKEPICVNISAETAFTTIAAFPVSLPNGMKNVMLLGWHKTHNPTLDIKAIGALVDMLMLVVDAHLTYYTQQYYIQSLEYLGDLSVQLNTFSDVSLMIKQAAHTGGVLLNADRYVVYLEKEQELHLVDSYGMSAEFANQFGVNAQAIDILKSGDPSNGLNYTRIIANNADESLPQSLREHLQREGIHAALSTVMHSNNQIFGTIWIFYNRPYIPSDYDVRLLEILAGQIAVTIENIELNNANLRNAQQLEQRVNERTSELAIALDKAQDADRLKGQLLSTVSHELRTPLAVIKAHTTTLLRYYDKLPVERHMQYLTTINEESDRLTEMISSLLDMSRLEAGMLDIQPIAFEPLELLQNFVTTIEPRYADRQLIRQFPENIPAIKADPERLRQLLANLVENASKYSPPGLPIEIGARAWDDALELWVKDQGAGLTPEQVRRVFDRFYQVNSADPKSSRSGVGLGLAIAKGLIEAMGGRIWAESAGLNQGSRFAFTIPWAAKNEETEIVE